MYGGTFPLAADSVLNNHLPFQWLNLAAGSEHPGLTCVGCVFGFRRFFLEDAEVDKEKTRDYQVPSVSQRYEEQSPASAFFFSRHEEYLESQLHADVAQQ